MTESLIKLRSFYAYLRAWVITFTPLAGSGFANCFKRICAARGFWLFVAELAGVVLVAYGISLWSVPAALIVGGLVLVGAIEVRPSAPPYPELPPPEAMLRAQAENAAIVINTERFGLAAVDPESMAALTPAECQRVITAARTLGARK